MHSRRRFIANSLGAGFVLTLPTSFRNYFTESAQPVKIGIITDLHQDVIHDAPRRLQAFIAAMKKHRPQALLQMGDFAYPIAENKAVIDAFNQAHAVSMHVLGNHDTDGGRTKQQCIDTWGMPGRYYVKEINGISFIILDGNDTGSPTYKGGYPAFINPEQTAWLQQQLAAIKTPVVIVSHQPLAGVLAVDNAAEIQDILAAHADKILVAINGHTHIDTLVQVKGINYIHLNSASYYWVGDKFKHVTLTPEILQKHPYIAYTCPYQDALYSLLTIDPANNQLTIKGTKTTWIKPSPAEINFSIDGLTVGKEIVPYISDRQNLHKHH